VQKKGGLPGPFIGSLRPQLAARHAVGHSVQGDPPPPHDVIPKPIPKESGGKMADSNPVPHSRNMVLRYVQYISKL